MKREELEVRRQSVLIEPDISRVIIKPFAPVLPVSPGYAARMKGLVKRVVELSEEDSRKILDSVFAEFRDRHRNLEETFRLGYERVKSFLPSR